MNLINLTGANLTGVEGTGRTYSITPAIEGIPVIQLDNQALIPNIDYTFTSGSQLVTFNVYILNVQLIAIYYTPVATALTGVAYTTAAYVQSEIRSTTAFSSSTIPSDTDVSRWIYEASREIDLLTNQSYISNVVTNQVLDYSGMSPIFSVPISGLISVEKVETNVTSYGATPSWVTLTEGVDYDYTVYLDSNEIQFNIGANSTLHSYPRAGYRSIRLSYTYGSTNVPYEIEHLATLMVAKRAVSTLVNFQANSLMGEVTVGPVSVTDPSQFSINYMKGLGDEITRLKDGLGLGFKVFKFPKMYDQDYFVGERQR